MYFEHAVVAIIVGVVFAVLKWRGPLEWLGHTASQAGRGELKALR